MSRSYKTPRLIFLGLSALGSSILASKELDPVYPKEKPIKDIKQVVLMWGKKSSIPINTDNDIKLPTIVPWFSESGFTWKKISFGPCFGVAVSHSGSLFLWGSDNDENKLDPIELKHNSHIIDAQCSKDSIFALDIHGNVIVWKFDTRIWNSSYKDNQILKTGKDDKILIPPLQNSFKYSINGLPKSRWFSNHYITHMSIGADHSAFVSNRGELYCHGDNNYGQCGSNPADGSFHYLEAKKVEIKESTYIMKAACGLRHTLALDKSGNVYSFGDDSKIQLLLGDTRSPFGKDSDQSIYNFSSKPAIPIPYKPNYSYSPYERHLQFIPRKIFLPSDSNREDLNLSAVFDIYTGDEFSLIKQILFSKRSSEGDKPVYILNCGGESQLGQCGHGINAQQQPLLAVRTPISESHLLTACGSNHCISFTDMGKLYGWGFNNHGQVGQERGKIFNPPVKIKLEHINEFVFNLSEKCKNDNENYPITLFNLFSNFDNSSAIFEI